MFRNIFYRKGSLYSQAMQVYTQDALDNAERIAKMWYADNPGELQHRVDMVNQYNAQNGTNIDPYRAIMLSADAGGQTFDNMALHVDGGGHTHSGGSHTVLTEQWASEHGVSQVQEMQPPFLLILGHLNFSLPLAVSTPSRRIRQPAGQTGTPSLSMVKSFL